MHLAQALAPDCWGALDFLDRDGKFIERKLTVRDVTLDSPPVGGKKKACIYFEGDNRKCFLANKELKAVGAYLMKYETSEWRGAVLLMTAGEKMLKGQKTLGMVVKNAAFRAAKPAGGENVSA